MRPPQQNTHHTIINHLLCLYTGGVGLQNKTEQVSLIEELLKSSTARFKLVVGHHPIRSYAEHCNYDATGDCAAVSFLGPLFQKYKVSQVG